jgi:WD40 repeat protein/serine/threonine protein kinase
MPAETPELPPSSAPPTASAAPSAHPEATVTFTWPHDSPPLWLTAGAEPVPGYRLTRLLGRGGFGEVWAADGPGGWAVALKVIPLTTGAAAVERQALEIIKTVRHPNLLTIFGTWERDDVLVIGMELADCTLMDRWKEAKGRGADGIPRGELLRYAAEAAKVLDFLNKPRHFPERGKPVGIQHGDVKPQNILLVGDGVKVGDFGLVQLLEKSVTAHSGGMTVSYAPPEFFEGRTSRWSDQYSLAVTYCELRTGKRPQPATASTGSTAAEPGPDVSSLPDSERPAMRRALDPVPRHRWPNCRMFVKELAESTRGRPEPPAPAAQPSSGEFALADEPKRTPSLPAELKFTTPEMPAAADTAPTPSKADNGWKATQAGGGGGKALAIAAAAAVLIAAVGGGVYWFSTRKTASTVSSTIASTASDAASEDDRIAKVERKAAEEISGLIRQNSFEGALKRVDAAKSDGARQTWKTQQALAVVTEWKKFAGNRPGIKDRVEEYNRIVQTVPDDTDASEQLVKLRRDLNAKSVEASNPPDVAIAKPGPVDSPSGSGPGPPSPMTEVIPRPIAPSSVNWGWPAALAVAVGLVAILLIFKRRTRRKASKLAERKSAIVTVRETRAQSARTAPLAAQTLNGHQDAVWCVAAAASGAVSGGIDGTVRVWDLAAGRERLCLTGHADGVLGVAVTDDGAEAVSVGVDGTLRRWDLRAGRELAAMDAGFGRLLTVALVPGRPGLALVAGDDPAPRLLDMAAAMEVRRFAGHAGRVLAVAVAPDGQIAASAGEDGTVRLWDLPTGRLARTLTGHAGVVHAVAFAPDGRHLLSGGADAIARWWGVESGREVRKFEGHADWVRGVAVTPDGRYAVTGGDDETVRVWDVASAAVATFVDHVGSVLGVAVMPDGRAVLSAGDDWTVAVRPVEK